MYRKDPLHTCSFRESFLTAKIYKNGKMRKYQCVFIRKL